MKRSEAPSSSPTSSGTAWRQKAKRLSLCPQPGAPHPNCVGAQDSEGPHS